MRSLAFAVLVLAAFAIIVPGAMGTIGSGVLYVYTDAGYNTLAPTGQPPGAFVVLPGQTVYIQIAGITEFNVGDSVLVKICWQTHVKTLTMTVEILTSGHPGARGVGDAAHPIAWTVGEFDDGYFDIPYCETMTVHYKKSSGSSPDYVAQGLLASVGHMHAIPETPFGTITPLLVLFVALGVFVAVKQKKLAMPHIK